MIASSSLLGQLPDPPYHYERGEEATVLFETEVDVLRTLLPPPLSVTDRGLMVLRAVTQQRSTLGPYKAAFLGVPALFAGRRVNHLLAGVNSDPVAVMACRHTLNMPVDLGVVDMAWRGGVLTISARRSGAVLVTGVIRLERRMATKPNRSIVSTFAARRQDFEQDSTSNVLLGYEAEADFENSQQWSAAATIRFGAGCPGNNWPPLPVSKIVSASLMIGGRSAFAPGALMASWTDPIQPATSNIGVTP